MSGGGERVLLFYKLASLGAHLPNIDARRVAAHVNFGLIGSQHQPAKEVKYLNCFNSKFQTLHSKLSFGGVGMITTWYCLSLIIGVLSKSGAGSGEFIHNYAVKFAFPDYL